MENLKYLLRKVSLLSDHIAYRQAQQENFNVFTTLLKYDDEVYLHSRFISCILDPQAPHKFGDLFLRHFLKTIGSTFSYNPHSVDVIPNNSSWTEYKDIDILIIDRAKQKAVIIENKIYAHDSNHDNEGQIEKYYRRLIEEDNIPADNIEVYYLRPKRNTPPSEDSIKKSGKFKELPSKLKLISYEQEISIWLALCIKEAANSPYLRETLNQYSKLINTMTNNTEIQDRLDLIATISTSNDTLNSAKLLLDNFCHIQWHTIYDFFNDLCHELEERGYSIIERCNDETITNIVFGGPQKRKNPITICFSDNKGYKYTIGADADDALYFGLSSDDNKGHLKEIRSFISANKDKVEGLEFDEGWEFWCYFDVEEDDDIWLWDFKKAGTFKLIRKENRLVSIKIHLDDFEKVISDLFS